MPKTRTRSSASVRANAGPSRGRPRRQRATSPRVRPGRSTASSSGANEHSASLPPTDESSVSELSMDRLLSVIRAEVQRCAATQSAGTDSTTLPLPAASLTLPPSTQPIGSGQFFHLSIVAIVWSFHNYVDHWRGHKESRVGLTTV